MMTLMWSRMKTTMTTTMRGPIATARRRRTEHPKRKAKAIIQQGKIMLNKAW